MPMIIGNSFGYIDMNTCTKKLLTCYDFTLRTLVKLIFNGKVSLIIFNQSSVIYADI